MNYSCRRDSRNGATDNRSNKSSNNSRRSDNRCYDDRCYCYCKPIKKGPEGGKAILKCSCGGSSGPVPIIALTQPRYITSVSIDFSGLENPTVLLTFTGDINLPGAATGTLIFIIKRICENGNEIPVGSAHNFVDAGSALEQTSFSFQACDCGSCGKCCTYTVYLDAGSVSGVAATPLSVSGAILTALAVGSDC